MYQSLNKNNNDENNIKRRGTDFSRNSGSDESVVGIFGSINDAGRAGRGGGRR